MSGTKPSTALLQLKLFLAFMAPLYAMAAEQTIRRVTSPQDLPIVTWAFILGAAILGWAVADLDKLAELSNTEGKTKYEIAKQRISFVKSVVASVVAGIGIFFLGKTAPSLLLTVMGIQQTSTPEIPEMALLMGVAVAGYMGTRFWQRAEERLTGKKQNE